MVGPSGLQPPDTGPPREDGLQKPVGSGVQSVQETYASKVTGKKKERMKLNVLDIFLERKNPSISYNLTKEELAKLLLKKMAIDPKFIIKIDTSGFGKLQVEMTDNVNPESMNNLPAFDIRDGLRTKFYRPHHRKDTLVTINWLDIETPDSLVTHILSHFGKIKSNVQWVKIKQEENESSLAKMLNNILSGERQIWMEVDNPIPSYAIIDGRKVKIYHPGQRRTCARCQKTADQCQGSSNAKICEENGGDKIKVETAWNEILVTVGFSEGSGGKEIVIEETKEDDDKSDGNRIDIGKEYPNCDGLILSNLPEDISDNNIKRMINSAVLNSADEVSILPSGNSRSRLIKNLDLSYLPEVMKKMDNKSFDGHLIHCRPHVPVTQPKTVAEKTPTVVVADETPKTVNVKGKADEKNNPKSIEEKKIVNPEIIISSGKKPDETSETSVSKIPGLSDKEQLKAIKSAEKKVRNAANKEKKKQKKEDQNLKQKMVKNDFLTRSDEPASAKVDLNEFEFSDYSSDDEQEVFEDSKDNLSDGEFLTPKALGRRKTALSTSTPNHSRKKSSGKRSASSPESSVKPKKIKSKLPLNEKK